MPQKQKRRAHVEDPQLPPSSQELQIEEEEEEEEEEEQQEQPPPSEEVASTNVEEGEEENPSPPPSNSHSEAKESKRDAENDSPVDEGRLAKKKATATDGSEEENVKKTKKFQRIWSEEDELAILKGMVDFTSKTGQDPFRHAHDFNDFVKESVHVHASTNQLKEKIRRLKRKFEINCIKGKSDEHEDPKFFKPHDHRAFELSKRVWGTHVKAPKKKLVAKSHAGPVLMESGKMDVDSEPIGGSSWPLREMFCFQSGYRVSEDDAKRGLELIGESKRSEMECKWNKLRAAEMKLHADRALLVWENTSLILEALYSSDH
ncbi:probable transcription factor At1g61730 [Abrus precatorius]|uniref:Probable transcription factor At1g61730 n=1 Tax=Abrus precatorius TaxID=3816 RepID=A0A8B8KRW7_ABRPR|nr:probable transcription factor At1g61730 [Abrus precatorius]